jgi:hypothetical protein
MTHPVAAAATTQVQLRPYFEEEPHMWFCLIEDQFIAAGIKLQKLKYTNAIASLPKQVLWDILDTLDVSDKSDDPFDCLKMLCLDSFERASGNPTLNYLASPWKCRASRSVFSWGSSNSTCLQEFLQTQICSWPCFSFACRLPCVKQ